MQRRSVLACGAVGLVIAVFAACSSSSETNANPAAQEAGASDDAVAKKEALPPIEDAAPAPCAPGDLPGFEAPSWTPPTAFGQHQCTDEQLRAILSCYFDENADQVTCNQVMADSANQGCNDCLFTDASKSAPPALGPFVIDASGYITPNVAGCLANFDGDASDTSCAAKYRAESVCEDEACTPNCTATDDAGYAAYMACLDRAAAGVCKTFATAGACAKPLLAPGGKASQCIPANDDYVASAITLGGLFCGGAVKDSGADAPHDAGGNDG